MARIQVNARTEVAAITVSRDAAPFGGVAGLSAAQAIVFQPEVADPVTSGNSRLGVDMPHSEANLQSAREVDKPNMRRENAAWTNLVRWNRCEEVMRTRGTPVLDFSTVTFAPADTAGAWAGLVPFDSARKRGPFQAWWSWIESGASKLKGQPLAYINAILLYNQLRAEVTSELNQYGIPLQAVSAVKEGMKQLKNIRSSTQRIVSAPDFKDRAKASRVSDVAAATSDLKDLPAIVKIIGASTELLTAAERLRLEQRSKAVSQFPGSIRGANNRSLTAKDIASEAAALITTRRNALIALWVESFNDSKEVEIDVPTLSP